MFHNFLQKFLGFSKECIVQIRKRNRLSLKLWNYQFILTREFASNDGCSCWNPCVTPINAWLIALFTELSRVGEQEHIKEMSLIASGETFGRLFHKYLSPEDRGIVWNLASFQSVLFSLELFPFVQIISSSPGNTEELPRIFKSFPWWIAYTE